MTTRPFNQLSLFFLFAFGLLALALGYWTFIDREALLARDDNPRALIAYNRIRRGQISDRNGLSLAETIGQPGDYIRQYEPAAALVVGYASFRYGLSGIEAAADSTLTGVEGQDPLALWWHFDVLAEPQIGSDVQLTLDRPLQQAAHAALGAHSGAVVVLEVATGEILAMASSPSFNPARLDTEFETFTEDSNGPLVNRATFGLYRADAVLRLFPQTLDLSQAPLLPIPTRPGEGNRVTPIQVALLATAVANNGVMPAPHLILDPAPASPPLTLLTVPTTETLRAKLRNGFAATVPSGFGDETLGWYVGLSRDQARAICVVLEDSTGPAARAVGQSILK